MSIIEKFIIQRLMSIHPVSLPALLDMATPKDLALSARHASSSNNHTFGDLVMRQASALSARHALISNNISNVTTPGYKSLDIQLAKNSKELREGGGLKKGKLSLTRTSSAHLQSSDSAPSSFPTVMQTDVEEKPNGNNVSLTGETVRLVQNQQKYNEALSIYNSSNNLIKSAIGKDNG